jgi:DNA polymerase-3 subunit alpha
MAANIHNDYAPPKNGRKPIDYLHPHMAQALESTYGLCVYQEEMMRLSQIFAGYSLEEADNLRKAAGKKIRKVMAEEREKFVAGCVEQGYGAELGTKLFDMIEPFADYAFNKSHSYGYGFVAYQTAYLKAHYPTEYFAALLTTVKDDKDKTAPYLAECRALSIQVRVPDINLSGSDFTARISGGIGSSEAGELQQGCPGVIPFGLSAIRNVGEGLVAQVISERDKEGPFTDFYDFCQRVDPMVLNKRAVESLIKAGAFDSLGAPRKGLLLVHEQIIDRTLARRRERDAGVMSLFDDLMDSADASFDDARVPIPDVEFDKHQKLVFEKEMLGLYVSDHPLMGFEASLRRATDCSVSELLEAKDGETRAVGGVVTNLVRKYTRKGDLMATFVLEDLESAINAWVFPRTMVDFGSLLADDAVVVVKGRLDQRDDEVKLVVMEVRRPELAVGGAPLQVVLPLSALTDRTVDRLKDLLLGHPGPSPVYLRMGSKTLMLADQFRVDTGNGLCAELRMLLGAECIAGA